MTRLAELSLFFLALMAELLGSAHALAGCSVWMTNTPNSMFDGLYTYTGNYSSRPYYVAILGNPAIPHYLYWNSEIVPGLTQAYGWTMGLGLQLPPYRLFNMLNVATADQLSITGWWWMPASPPATSYCCIRVACSAPAACAVKLLGTPYYPTAPMFDGTYAYMGTFNTLPFYVANLGNPPIPHYLYWNSKTVPGLTTAYGWSIGLGLQLEPYNLFTNFYMPTADQLQSVTGYWWWMPSSPPATRYCCIFTSCAPNAGINCQGNYNWQTCSKSCGGGTQTGAWTVTVPAMFGGSCPQQGTSYTRSCNTQSCAVDCQGYYNFSECSATCDGGVQSGPFVVTVPPQNGGGCPLNGTIGSQTCNTDPCPAPVDCQGYYNYSECSASCDGGFQSGPFVVTAPPENGGGCPLNGTIDTQACNTDPCVAIIPFAGLVTDDEPTPNATCAANFTYPCPKGYHPKPKGANCSSPVCIIPDCCDPNPTCARNFSYPCPKWHNPKPVNTNCSGPSCSCGDCCNPNPTCSANFSFPCPKWFNPKPLNTNCSGPNCIRSDCCNANPTCSSGFSFPCPKWFNQKPTGTNCSGPSCSLGDCCNQNPTCRNYTVPCPTGYAAKPVTTNCSGPSCSSGDCCTQCKMQITGASGSFAPMNDIYSAQTTLVNTAASYLGSGLWGGKKKYLFRVVIATPAYKGWVVGNPLQGNTLSGAWARTTADASSPDAKGVTWQVLSGGKWITVSNIAAKCKV